MGSAVDCRPVGLCYEEVTLTGVPEVQEFLAVYSVQGRAFGLKGPYSLVSAFPVFRVCLCVRLMDSCEVLPRTCELARLYGCCLHSALTRGSQFKVENILLRATKRMNCVLVSPSKQQARKSHKYSPT